MRFAFYTLGCKTNQYETQAMEQLLTELGHEIGQFDQPCDGYIINTCSVTAVADKKNRAVIRRCRRDNPDAVIGVCGCYSQHAPEAVRALGVDIIGGSGGRREFVELMLSAMEGKIRAEQLDDALRRREFEVLPAGGLEERTRAMLKVQDGCVNFCSYCIIPYTRGPIRSAPVDVAVSQAQELARQAGGHGADRGGLHRRSGAAGAAGQSGTANRDGGFLPAAFPASEPLSPVPPVHAVRVRHGIAADAAEV